MPFTGAISKVPNVTLHERIYGELKQALLAGHLASGEVVTIRPLAEELGTSVMPVRDALLRLAAERALELMPNRSIRVPRMTRAGFDELYRIRGDLESMAAGMAAENIQPGEISELEAHRRRIHEATESGESGDAGAWVEAYKDFHFRVFAAARSVHLMPMIESMWLQSGPILSAPFKHAMADGTEKGAAARQSGGVDALLEALKSGDAAAARAAVEAAFSEETAWFHANFEFDAPDENMRTEEVEAG
ncbi:MAG: GntR family transcriptional regulator [Alphaproteobacteria bacterium]|jgi:DNA-binding GntR family transcriptional regulator|nr:GntR family transcriptional regulator [Alphaproteobacteria bacterium]MDP6588560.1 GntR family transcriptional regulator [Alphaproteobacteria bacterium]MDP6817733.1 GntR family transcriptional regulator [Alphaproteobacteria bacterium]